MNAVSFLSHLLAILIEKFKVRVIAFENLEHEQISSNKSTPSFWQYTLFLFIILTDSPKVIYPV